MAANVQKLDLVDIDLTSGTIHRSWIKQSIGSADVKGNAFGVRVFRDGEPVTLSSVSVYGYFRDPHGNNIAITSGNSVSGNVAYVVLPAACYNYEGQFCLAIKLIGGGITDTVRIVDGMVDDTHTGSAVAPTSAVPSYSEILSTYDAMVAATAVANAAIAPTYDTLTFPVYKGQPCIYNGGLYKAKQTISSSEVWTSSHWEATTFGDEMQGMDMLIQNDIAMIYNEEVAYDAGKIVIKDGVTYLLPNGHTAGTAWASTTKTIINIADHFAEEDTALKSQMNNIYIIDEASSSDFEQGTIRADNGSNDGSASNRIRTKSYISKNITIVKTETGYKFALYAYNSSGVYQGVWDGSSLTTSSTLFDNVNLTEVGNYKFKLVVLKSNTTSNLSPSDATNVSYMSFTDKTLTVANAAADAKETGNKINQIIDSLSVDSEAQSSDFEQGSIYATSGQNTSTATNRIRTIAYIEKNVIRVKAGTGYKFALFAYNSFGTYQGVWDGSALVKTSAEFFTDVMLPDIGDYKFRLLVVKSDGTSNLSPSDAENVIYTDFFIDKSLSIENLAAGAKETGDKINSIINMITTDKDATSSEFEQGSIAAATGANYQSASNRIRTISYIDEKILSIRTKTGYKFVLYAYNSSNVYQGMWNGSELSTTSVFITNVVLSDVGDYKFRLVVVKSDTTSDLSPSNASNVVYSAIGIPSSDTGGDVHDKIETQGVLNVVKRAYQLAKLSYKLNGNLPKTGGGTISSGTTVHGLVYSAAIAEYMGYVGNNVSIDTYMTAIKSANSYLYSQRINGRTLSAAIYGVDCSGFVTYAYGIDDMTLTTACISQYPGIERLPDELQNPQSLKIGDILNAADSHVILITDIIRDERGIVKKLEVSEGWQPNCRIRLLTVNEFNSGYSGYTAYRYANINKVSYADSQWVDPFDGDISPTWNTYLMPRRGDKANWIYGEDVKIDILSAGSYTQYVVTNRDTGTTVSTGSVSSTPITLSNVASGKYECHLTNGSSSSGSVYFNVVKTTDSFTPDGNGHVTVSYSSDDGTPCTVVFCTSTGTSVNAARTFHLLTNAEISAGSCTLNIPSPDASHAPNGVWHCRVYYKTPFGLFAGEIHEVTLT